MEFDMLLNKRAHVPETMVVLIPGLKPEIVFFLVQSINKVLNMHQMGELIMGADIQKQGRFEILWRFYKLGCIVFFAFFLPVHEELFEAFLAPAFAGGRVADWSESWGRFVFSCLQRCDQSAMASDAEPRDRHIVPADWEECWDNSRKLFSDVGEHLEMLFILVRGRVDVVTGWVSELPVICHTFNVSIPRAGVRENNGNPMFPCVRSKPRLNTEILMIWP